MYIEVIKITFDWLIICIMYFNIVIQLGLKCKDLDFLK